MKIKPMNSKQQINAVITFHMIIFLKSEMFVDAGNAQYADHYLNFIQPIFI